jgi:hypothetical protein
MNITFDTSGPVTTVRRNGQHFGKIIAQENGFNAIGTWFNVTLSNLAAAKECFIPATPKPKITVNPITNQQRISL